MKKVIVLLGGDSSEREVSLVTGEAVYNALCKFSDLSVSKYVLNEDIISFVNYLEKNKDAVIFNALHGNFGEDGRIQSLLDLMKIPYTHSGVIASSLCMNKHLIKSLLKSIGIPTALHQEINPKSFDLNNLLISYPLIVKPNNAGSSVDIYVINDDKELLSCINKLSTYNSLLLEQYINGVDCTVSVINGEPLAVTEIIPMQKFYDYHAKYIAKDTKHILPASFSMDMQKIMQDYAKQIYHEIGARGAIRVDFLYHKEQSKIYFLEVNTQPGMTETSLLPEQAKYTGVSFSNLCYKLLNLATFDN